MSRQTVTLTVQREREAEHPTRQFASMTVVDDLDVTVSGYVDDGVSVYGPLRIVEVHGDGPMPVDSVTLTAEEVARFEAALIEAEHDDDSAYHAHMSHAADAARGDR